MCGSAQGFQSTLSVRRATHVGRCRRRDGHISIHALREESDPDVHASVRAECISIHALREESDPLVWQPPATLDAFQSTLSVRRATRGNGDRMNNIQISIHALREESDDRIMDGRNADRISIHALREESDVTSPLIAPNPSHFNPRSP